MSAYLFVCLSLYLYIYLYPYPYPCLCIYLYLYLYLYPFYIQGFALARGTFLLKIFICVYDGMFLRVNFEMVILWNTTGFMVDLHFGGSKRKKDRKIEMAWPRLEFPTFRVVDRRLINHTKIVLLTVGFNKNYSWW